MDFLIGNSNIASFKNIIFEVILSVIIGIILMCLSGHVLTSPAVSIYLSVVMMLLIVNSFNLKIKKKTK